MYKTITLSILFFGLKIAYAQFNDTTHYHIMLNSTGSINKTNAAGNAYLLNNALNFGLKKDSLVLTATNSWVYGRQNNTLTNNDFSSTLFFDLHTTIRHFYYWGLLNYNTSYSLKINNQVLGGFGLAYSIFDHKNAWLNLSDGILYDQSDLVTTANYHTYRNSFRLMYHFAGKIFTLDGTNYLQNSLSRGNDYIIRSTTTFGFKLQKWLSLTTALNYNRMNITRSENLIFTYGLTVDKYF